MGYATVRFFAAKGTFSAIVFTNSTIFGADAIHGFHFLTAGGTRSVPATLGYISTLASLQANRRSGSRCQEEPKKSCRNIRTDKEFGGEILFWKSRQLNASAKTFRRGMAEKGRGIWPQRGRLFDRAWHSADRQRLIRQFRIPLPDVPVWRDQSKPGQRFRLARSGFPPLAFRKPISGLGTKAFTLAAQGSFGSIQDE